MLRKTRYPGGGLLGYVGASMRPQRNAAENRMSAEEAEQCFRASMRPQRNAAENIAYALNLPSPDISLQ